MHGVVVGPVLLRMQLHRQQGLQEIIAQVRFSAILINLVWQSIQFLIFIFFKTVLIYPNNLAENTFHFYCSSHKKLIIIIIFKK